MALTFDPNSGILSGALERKQIPGMDQILSGVFTGLESKKPNYISYSPVLTPGMETQIKTTTAPVAGLGQDYWDSLTKQGIQRVQKQYFDPGGIKQQAEESFASRGLTGSGVEQGLLNEQVYNPFGTAVSDIVQDVIRQQAQHGVDIEKYNRDLGLRGMEMLNNLAMSDRKMGMEADIANKQIDEHMMDLATQVALAERGQLSAEAEADLDRQLKQAQLAVEAYDQNAKMRLGYDSLKAEMLKVPWGEMSPEQQGMWAKLFDNFGSGGGGGGSAGGGGGGAAPSGPSGAGQETAQDLVDYQNLLSDSLYKIHWWTDAGQVQGRPNPLIAEFEQTLRMFHNMGYPKNADTVRKAQNEMSARYPLTPGGFSRDQLRGKPQSIDWNGL